MPNAIGFLIEKELNVIVGKSYNIYANEKNPVIFEQNPDLLRFTHGGKTEYSKDTHEKYGLDSENLMYYAHSNLKPSYKVNNYDGFKDYMSYMFDVYGVEESYAGYLAGLLGVRDLAENLAYDIVPDFPETPDLVLKVTWNTDSSALTNVLFVKVIFPFSELNDGLQLFNPSILESLITSKTVVSYFK
jgi:hypothetical protein